MLTGRGGASSQVAGGFLARIDPETNKVVATIGVGEGPGPLAVGKRAVWVGNHSSGTVSMIDPATNRVVETSDAHGNPGDIAAVDEPDTAWIAGAYEDKVLAISPVGPALPARPIPVRPHRPLLLRRGREGLRLGR
jgi:YVTN family beta-propeller protein